MAATKEQVFEQVRDVLVDALGVDEEEVKGVGDADGRPRGGKHRLFRHCLSAGKGIRDKGSARGAFPRGNAFEQS